MEATVEKTALRKKVNDILLDVSWAQISKKYFGKSRSWLNHKINGVSSNGGTSEINHEDTQKLKEALHDLASRIDKCADSL